MNIDTYKYDHPDADLFNENHPVETKINRAPWPCVVVGAEPPKEKEQKDGVS